MDLLPAPTAGMIVSVFETWRGKVFYANVSPDAREPTLMCWSTVLTPSFILTQCRKLTGPGSCALRVSIHSLPAKKGSECYLLPSHLWGVKLFLQPVGTPQSTWVCVGQKHADTWKLTHLFSLKAQILHLPPPFLGDSVIGHLVQCLLEGTSWCMIIIS